MKEVPRDTIRILETAVDRLRKRERSLESHRLTPQGRTDLLAAVEDVDDAWEEHVAAVRTWVGWQ